MLDMDNWSDSKDQHVCVWGNLKKLNVKAESLVALDQDVYSVRVKGFGDSNSLYFSFSFSIWAVETRSVKR